MRRNTLFPLLMAAALGACAPTPPPEAEPGRLVSARQPRVSAPCRSSPDLRCIAIVAQGEDTAAVNAATVIGDDLAWTERFAVLKRESLPAADRLDALAATGAEALLVVSAGASRTLKLELKDLRTRATVATQEVPQGRSPRATAHRAADVVFERLSGVRGVAATSIAYVERITDRGTPMFRLSVADADGANVSVIVESREPILSPTWAPDAAQLAWMGYDRGPSAIFVKDLRTGAVRKVIAEATAASAPAFSPDGRSLAFSLNSRNGSDLYLVDLASGARRQLTQTPGIDTEPSWSPDGRTIAFTSDRGGQPQIYAMSADGGPARLLSHGSKQALRPCYSPDGRSLALVMLERGRFKVGLLGIADGRLRALGDGPGDESPSFAPNGQTLLYTAQASDHGELIAIALDRGSSKRVRPDADVRAVSWSPYRR